MKVFDRFDTGGKKKEKQKLSILFLEGLNK